MNTLFLCLEGPLQSWGERARWGQRDTQREPTKSGVIGLLACALGWGLGRDDDIRDLNNSLRMGVRVDSPGRVLRDYHTITGGVLSAEGKIKVTAATGQRETVLSDRFYLSDASFLVALRGQDSTILHLEQALQSPVWPPFLGRRSCPPSRPFLVGSGSYSSLREALAAQPPATGYDGRGLRLVLETDQGFQRNDNVDSLSVRTYVPRYVEETTVVLEVE